jgi:hypothetical protein
MWNSVHIAYVFALYLKKKKHKKCSFAQYMNELKWIKLWILKEIGQSAMHAQVATFAGCLIPSQIARSQATNIICLFLHSALRLVVSYEDISPQQTHIWCLFCIRWSCCNPWIIHFLSTCRYDAEFLKVFSHRWTIIYLHVLYSIVQRFSQTRSLRW